MISFDSMWLAVSILATCSIAVWDFQLAIIVSCCICVGVMFYTEHHLAMCTSTHNATRLNGNTNEIKTKTNDKCTLPQIKYESKPIKKPRLIAPPSRKEMFQNAQNAKQVVDTEEDDDLIILINT